MDFEGQHYFPGIPALDTPYQNHLTTAPAQVTANLAYKWTCFSELSAEMALLAQQVGTARENPD